VLVRRCARALLVLVVAVAPWASNAPSARADGDPASDVLLYQGAFFPYSAPSTAAKARLLGAVAAARRAGFPIRVAVVQARQDLGADPELFGTPQVYARFLDAELVSTGYTGALVVVMPQGFGVAPGGRVARGSTKLVPRPIAPLRRAIAPLRPPATTDPDALTVAGVAAVRAVAAATGHPLPSHIRPVAPPSTTPPTRYQPPGSSRSSTFLISGGLAIGALVGIAMIGIGIRRGRRPGPDI
jgi:hypothetical protein